MWIFLIAVGIVLAMLLKKDGNRKLLIYSFLLGVLVLAVGYFYLHLGLSACVYMGIVTMFIWYLMFNILYKLFKRQ